MVQLLCLFLQIPKCCVMESEFLAHRSGSNKDVHGLSASLLDMIFNTYDGVEQKKTHVSLREHKQDGQTKPATLR